MIRKGIPFLLTLLISAMPAVGLNENGPEVFSTKLEAYDLVDPNDSCSRKCYLEWVIINQLDNQLQFYEDLTNELWQYEKKVQSGVGRWFSVKPALILSTIGSALGVQKVLEYLEQQGCFADAVNDVEHSLLKGYCGVLAGITLFAAGYAVGSTVLNYLISNPLSRCKVIRMLFAFNPHVATKYLKQRLLQTKRYIINLCRQLPLETVDKKRHNAFSEVKKELLMEVAQQLL